MNTGQYIVSKPGRYTDDQFTANWDREFHGGKDKMSARFFFSNGESVSAFWRRRAPSLARRNSGKQHQCQ